MGSCVPPIVVVQHRPDLSEQDPCRLCPWRAQPAQGSLREIMGFSLKKINLFIIPSAKLKDVHLRTCCFTSR